LQAILYRLCLGNALGDGRHKVRGEVLYLPAIKPTVHPEKRLTPLGQLGLCCHLQDGHRPRRYLYVELPRAWTDPSTAATSISIRVQGLGD
jgi:hypothetical protein